MKIVNLTATDVLDGLQRTRINERYLQDNYRKFSEFDKDNVLGIYYREYNRMDLNAESLNRRIKYNKECCDFEHGWEYLTMGHLFGLVSRLEETYDEISEKTDLKSPIVTGIALYQNYPVGILLPKELLDYKRLCDLINDSEFSNDERLIILNEAKSMLERLTSHGVYCSHIEPQNIRVNPNNHLDVRFDGVDNPGFAVVESEDRVKELKDRGLDLKKYTMKCFEIRYKV